MSTYVFPERLRGLREEIGLNQAEFAAAMGVSRASISYYENGDRVPDIKFLIDLYDKTGCSVQFLLGHSDNMKEANIDRGLITNLTDKSLDMLDALDTESRTINTLISHKQFPRLVGVIKTLIDPDAKELRYGESAFYDYKVFEATNIIRKIADNPEDRHETYGEIRHPSSLYFSSREEAEHLNFQKDKDEALYELMKTPHSYTDEECDQVLQAVDKTLSRCAELKKDMAEEARLSEDRYAEYEKQEEERAKTDPLLRFYRRMTRI